MQFSTWPFTTSSSSNSDGFIVISTPSSLNCSRISSDGHKSVLEFFNSLLESPWSFPKTESLLESLALYLKSLFADNAGENVLFLYFREIILSISTCQRTLESVWGCERMCKGVRACVKVCKCVCEVMWKYVMVCERV